MNLIKIAICSLAIISTSSVGFSLSFSPKPIRQIPYPTVSINQFAAEKDKRTNVTYLTPDQREQYRVVIEYGIVYTPSGAKFPDTINSKAGHINHINYVMNANGDFYLFSEYATPNIRHSSIFAGGPVAGAGEIVIKNSHITYIDSDSGHYHSAALMPNVLSELNADGVDVRNLVQ